MLDAEIERVLALCRCCVCITDNCSDEKTGVNAMGVTRKSSREGHDHQLQTEWIIRNEIRKQI